VREWTWWAHTGGGHALAFKQPTYDIESGPGGLTREVETHTGGGNALACRPPPIATGDAIPVEQHTVLRSQRYGVPGRVDRRWMHLQCWRVANQVWAGLPDPASSSIGAFTAALARQNEVQLSGFSELSPADQYAPLTRVSPAAQRCTGLLGSFVWHRPGLFQCRFRIGYRSQGLKRQMSSGQSRVYCRPKQFYCRPRPAAQPLPISPDEKVANRNGWDCGWLARLTAGWAHTGPSSWRTCSPGPTGPRNEPSRRTRAATGRRRTAAPCTSTRRSGRSKATPLA
jgi:hypothetical protein